MTSFVRRKHLRSLAPKNTVAPCRSCRVSRFSFLSFFLSPNSDQAPPQTRVLRLYPHKTKRRTRRYTSSEVLGWFPVTHLQTSLLYYFSSPSCFIQFIRNHFTLPFLHHSGNTRDIIYSSLESRSAQPSRLARSLWTNKAPPPSAPTRETKKERETRKRERT